MSNLGFIIGSAALTFTVTNIDVFCLLVLFFAKAKVDKESTNANVWISQAIGFTVIVGVSLLGLVLSASVETKYVSLLGAIPIIMGVRSMYHDWDWEYINQRMSCRGGTGHLEPEPQQPEEPAAADVKDVEMASAEEDGTCSPCSPTSTLDLTASTQGTGLEDLMDSISVMSESESGSENGNKPFSRVKVFLKRFLPAQLVEMTFITVANGGDNIAIYLPIFAACSTDELVVTVIVYYVLMCVWLVAAYALLGDRRLIGYLHRYGHYVVPLCLIATGVYILSGSVLFMM